MYDYFRVASRHPKHDLHKHYQHDLIITAIPSPYTHKSPRNHHLVYLQCLIRFNGATS